MTARNKLVCTILVFITCFTIGYGRAASTVLADFPVQEEPPGPPPEVEEAIREAFLQAARQNRSQVLGLMVFEPVIDNVQFSADQAAALIWVAFRDPDSGEVIETEPGLSLARSSPGLLASADGWTITLPSDGGWKEQIAALPEELLSEDVRARLLDQAPENGLTAAPALTGYKLPWTAGLSKRVTNSIGHYLEVNGGLASCPATCRYAYDFADGTMFPLLAAKGGTVKSVKWTCLNFGTDCTNYLILEDQSTVPTTYQVYYHMAYNSVPQRLRKPGAQVLQGEYVGDTDDTGYSTGHHLHYHVFTTPNRADWSWGASVDFKFDDVPTNGGYPRTCAESAAYPSLGSQCMKGNLYTSGNTPAHPPTASLAAPSDRQVVTGRAVRVAGTASDDVGIARIQVLANVDGSWKTIDDIPPTGNGPFQKEVDLCAAGVPDGPLALTVRVYDREGSQARDLPTRQLIKTASCAGPVEPPPAPACAPAANQVALYAETDFRGACAKFDLNKTGSYTGDRLGALGNDNAASIQVGSGVAAVLFDRDRDAAAPRVTGRVETFLASDASLADNRIGIDTVSGLWVHSRSLGPDVPFINALGNGLAAGANLTSLDSLVLAWEGGAGAASFDVTLNGPGAGWTRAVTGATSLSIGSLDPGVFTLTVRSRNSQGTNSASRTFTVAPAAFPAADALPAPYQDDLENGSGGWVASGLWRHTAIEIGGRAASKAWVYNDGTDTIDPTWRAGDLTSPPIAVPPDGTYYLRFAYYADIEDGGPYWDQRRVQVSDGGRFTDLAQLTDDKQVGQLWLDSGPISLASYAGKTIRLRFHYDAVDQERNAGKGWAIDDVRITGQAPEAGCADANGTPAAAQPIALKSTLAAAICPERDVDFYRFTAEAGQPLLVDVDARTLSPASRLDPYVFLLDGDGRSVLAENDDEQYGVRQDSLLSYTIQRSGTYYLKLRAWDYPGAGSAAHFYRLSLNQNAGAPPQSASILFPAQDRLAPTLPFEIAVQAVDYDGGPVQQVAFYWHGADWSNPEWTYLGADTDGSDGWSQRVDPSRGGGVEGAAIYAQARGRLGGVTGAALWDLVADRSTPVSGMNALPGQVNSTAFRLSWSASDAQDDIQRFELQYQVRSGGSWSGWQPWSERTLPGSLRSTWFLGAAGSAYRFRLHAIDRAGNVEAYPELPEAATTLAAACAPDPAEAQGQTLDSAAALGRGKLSPVYNLCRPGAVDVDWLALDVQPERDLLIILLPRGGGAAFSATLYDARRKPVGAWQSADYETVVNIRYPNLPGGAYYLEIKPRPEGLSGTDARYQVWYGPGSWLYLPWVNSPPSE
jgi:hypothetical protein